MYVILCPIKNEVAFFIKFPRSMIYRIDLHQNWLWRCMCKVEPISIMKFMSSFNNIDYHVRGLTWICEKVKNLIDRLTNYGRHFRKLLNSESNSMKSCRFFRPDFWSTFSWERRYQTIFDDFDVTYSWLVFRDNQWLSVNFQKLFFLWMLFAFINLFIITIDGRMYWIFLEDIKAQTNSFKYYYYYYILLFCGLILLSSLN